MTGTRCAEMVLLIQADIDGELDAGQAATVAAHVATCGTCRGVQRRLAALSGRLRTELPYHVAPLALRDGVLARIAAASPQAGAATGGAIGGPMPPAPVRPGDPPGPANDNPWRRLFRAGSRSRPGVAFGAGFAVAASLALLMILPGGGDPAGDIVADHIRALQPGHLTDVVSADQHTVKPWFDGRLDYAPPVRDFADKGFPLAGGRLDYLEGRPVAALVYRRDKHVIDLFVWPVNGRMNHTAAEGSSNGYNYVRWTQDEMEFWAVSDLNAREMDDFARLWGSRG